jgi:hypothetical protein
MVRRRGEGAAPGLGRQRPDSDILKHAGGGLESRPPQHLAALTPRSCLAPRTPQLAAAAAGADIVDAAIDSMSGLTSQPNMGAIVGSLAGTDLDTGIDPRLLLKLSNYWEATREREAWGGGGAAGARGCWREGEPLPGRRPRGSGQPARGVRPPPPHPLGPQTSAPATSSLTTVNPPPTPHPSPPVYAPYESNMRYSSSDVYMHEMPGGQYTNLKFQVGTSHPRRPSRRELCVQQLADGCAALERGPRRPRPAARPPPPDRAPPRTPSPGRVARARRQLGQGAAGVRRRQPRSGGHRQGHAQQQGGGGGVGAPPGVGGALIRAPPPAWGGGGGGGGGVGTVGAALGRASGRDRGAPSAWQSLQTVKFTRARCARPPSSSRWWATWLSSWCRMTSMRRAWWVGKGVGACWRQPCGLTCRRRRAPADTRAHNLLCCRTLNRLTPITRPPPGGEGLRAVAARQRRRVHAGIHRPAVVWLPRAPPQPVSEARLSTKSPPPGVMGACFFPLTRSAPCPQPAPPHPHPQRAQGQAHDRGPPRREPAVDEPRLPRGAAQGEVRQPRHQQARRAERGAVPQGAAFVCCWRGQGSAVAAAFARLPLPLTKPVLCPHHSTTRPHTPAVSPAHPPAAVARCLRSTWAT